jgi:hypothetical protein
MPSSAPPSSSTPRRRPESKNRRRPDHGYELRAAVTSAIHEHLQARAAELGRSRSWHAGLYIEALGRVDKELTPEERAAFDVLLCVAPERLLAPIRAALASKP